MGRGNAVTGFAFLALAPFFPVPGGVVPPDPVVDCLAVTVEDVERWFNITPSAANNAVVGEAIRATQDYIAKNHLYQPICRTTVTWYMVGANRSAMFVPFVAVVSLNTVAKLDPVTGIYVAELLTDYRLVEWEGGVALVKLSGGSVVSWGGCDRYRVTFTAGWGLVGDNSLVPATLRQAVRAGAGYLLRKSGITGVGKDRVGVESQGEPVGLPAPPATYALLAVADLTEMDQEFEKLVAPFKYATIYGR